MHRACLSLLLGLALSCAAEERPLRFAIAESSVMPLLQQRGDRAEGGILYDLQMRMAEKVGRKAELLVMPRKRVQQMLVDGEIDVRCNVNPAWLHESHYQYIWSVPFMVQRDLLVGMPNSPAVQDLAQLHGETIGTVLGYSYPTLQPLFDSGELRRDDARTQELVLAKLVAGRYRYAVSNELSLNWFSRQHHQQASLRAMLKITEDLAACIVRDEPDVPTMRLLRALVQMSNDGEFQAILGKYR
ncbi:substrate-binding periplasmic protein [Pseudomonas sp. LRF_L74]|uniref:substrate-binding periplasmic protein n=1 Tax=Pseudomonas sp. LRF_L74 TaxID=3369422 RepID=UPI003F5EC985